MAMTAFAFMPLLLNLQAAVVTKGAKVGEWTMDYDAALALAKKESKPILLNFTGSDWCSWCKLMDRKVFEQDEWRVYAEKELVLVYIDFPRNKNIVPNEYKERNKELAKSMFVRGYPTYILLDSDGETKIGRLGAGRNKTPKTFITEIERHMSMTSKGIEKFAKENPKQAEAYKAAIVNFNEKKKAFDAWKKSKPQRTPENRKALENHMNAVKEAGAELSKFRSSK